MRLEEVKTDAIGDFPQSLAECTEGGKSQPLVENISNYALSKSLEEPDTNVTAFSQSLYQCQTLRALKLGPYSSDLPNLSSLTLLMTLELTDVWLRDCDFFSKCLVLENLSIIDCEVFSTLNISAPQLVKLVISNYRSSKKNRNGKIVRTSPNDGKIVITAPRLKFFNLKEVDPLVLSMDGCPTLENVDIHITQPFCQKLGDKKQTFILDVFHMIVGLIHVKSVSKEKFILCRNNVDEETKIAVLNKGTFILSYRYADAETKVMELKKETIEERVLFVYPMVNGFDLNQFATILEELFGEKEAHISNQIEIDRLSNLPDHIIYDILSFLDTKYVVQTCVLSNKWRYHWIHIHNLNLECRRNTIANFKKFVLHVLRHRKPLNLNRLRFHFNGRKSQSLVESISSYALSKSLEELDTNVTFLENLYGFKLAYTKCLVFENLSIIECEVLSILKISAPRLVKLVISNFRSSKRNKNGKVVLAEPNDGKILITTPRLKFFYLKDVDPLVLSMDDCPSLEKVDILMSKPFCDFFQKIGDKKQMFIRDMFHMIEGLFHAKSLRISLNFTKEKFVLRRNNEETKIAVLNKETGEEQLVWPLYWKKSKTRAHEVAAKLLRKQFKNFVPE
ncbi:hypothetical protein LWI28_004741 [Acer negundo]|uniref:F-box domain-containing protein n=1 Tax=Acer negundo TaxID=4023 RepID=A0AAD5I978_ACENE|nr:hypothetical protein LWI28_004741 [Acer negundo]